MAVGELVGHQRKLADGCQTAGAVSTRPRSVAAYAVESERSQTAELRAAPSDSEPLDGDVTGDSQPQHKPVIS